DTAERLHVLQRDYVKLAAHAERDLPVPNHEDTDFGGQGLYGGGIGHASLYLSAGHVAWLVSLATAPAIASTHCPEYWEQLVHMTRPSTLTRAMCPQCRHGSAGIGSVRAFVLPFRALSLPARRRISSACVSIE